MANGKSQLFILYFLLVTLLGQTVALSEVLPVQEVIANQPEQDQNQVDVDEAISPQEQETDLTSSIVDAMGMIADRLEANQEKHYDPKGSWPAERHFTGSIVAGMVSAYELTGESAYQASAELGGRYILRHAEGHFYGDEAFALLRFSQISDGDPWYMHHERLRADVRRFYSVLSNEGRTNDYISEFADTEPSTAVFYLANHVVAAYYVDAEDKQTWRQALIDYLAQVDDDSSDFPVMALGIATWALALTGPLDDTLIPSGTGAAYWSGKKLADLPDLLLSHQVPDGELYADSFYWRFDHGDGGSGGPVSGYTEDAIFTTLGLIAASRGDPALDLDAAIRAAGQALLGGVRSGGKVFEHLWLVSADYYTYGGEMLQVLGELAIQENWPG